MCARTPPTMQARWVRTLPSRAPPPGPAAAGPAPEGALTPCGEPLRGVWRLLKRFGRASFLYPSHTLIACIGRLAAWRNYLSKKKERFFWCCDQGAQMPKPHVLQTPGHSCCQRAVRALVPAKVHHASVRSTRTQRHARAAACIILYAYLRLPWHAMRSMLRSLRRAVPVNGRRCLNTDVIHSLNIPA